MYGQIVKQVQVLEKVGKVAFPGAKKFVASDKFTEPKFWLSEAFKTWMLPKVEKGVKPSTLAYGKIIQALIDEAIIRALGGIKKAEISLAEIFYLMSFQPNGDEGVLLTNGRANIFYVKDVKGILRIVGVGWRHGQWNLYTNQTSIQHGWGVEGRAFSRN